MNVNRNRIRQVYYIGTICIVVVLLMLLSVIHLRIYHTDTNKRIEQLADNSIELKKQHLKDTVERIIKSIEIERMAIEPDIARYLEAYEGIIVELLSKGYLLDEVVLAMKPMLEKPEEVKLVIVDNNTGEIATAINLSNEEISSISLEEYLGVSSEISGDEYTYILGVSNAYIERQVQNRIALTVRNLRPNEEDYIWINHILDYEGGDDYAIRLVHPNLPKTEGDYLSTDITDIKGNKPYEEELEGIKENGELFFDYYFKEFDSAEITHKLSFAKLYEPYDWVIATGIHMNDIEAVMSNEKLEFQNAYRRVLYQTIIISVIFLILAIILLIIFERQINQLIESYKMKFEEQNRQIEEEKEKIEELAYFDPLTEIANRRAVENYLKEFISRGKRHGECFSVVLGDIDWFKNINDNFGHNVGDQVLQEIANIIKTNIRAEDIVGRWGGEEFIILLTYTDKDKAYNVVEKIRAIIESYEFSYKDYDIRCTMSFGIACFSENTESAEALIGYADKALYNAKDTGRNRVCISQK